MYALIVEWSGLEWFCITLNSIFAVLFLVIGWYRKINLWFSCLFHLVYCSLACTALVKSQEWMQTKRAMEGGRPSEESWVIFCLFDKGPLILFSGLALVLCTVSIAFWSLALVHQNDWIWYTFTCRLHTIQHALERFRVSLRFFATCWQGLSTKLFKEAIVYMTNREESENSDKD